MRYKICNFIFNRRNTTSVEPITTINDYTVLYDPKHTYNKSNKINIKECKPFLKKKLHKVRYDNLHNFLLEAQAIVARTS